MSGNMKKPLSCPICQKRFRQVTTIEVCGHQFCHNCIRKRITEEGLHRCPECSVDLGPTPLQTLRMDLSWQIIMDYFNAEESQEIESSRHSKESDLPNSSNSKERFFSSNQSTTSSNKKQKHETSKAGDDGIRSIVQQSSELQASHWVEVPEVDDNTKRNERRDTFWFCLVASENRRSWPPLEQIPSRYLRVRDGNITVSHIKKYLVQRLNLRSEDEVEISLEGRKLLPSLQLRNLMDLWLQTKATARSKIVALGSSAEEFVMVLTYNRKSYFSI